MLRCRSEYFVFSLSAEMLGLSPVELYAITCNGSIHQYPQVRVAYDQFMPSGGALSNPKDKESVTYIEDKMIEEYGKAIAVAKCKKGKQVDLTSKMIRAVHVEALGAAVNQYKVVSLNLGTNQLRAEGAKAIGSLLEGSSSLTTVSVPGHKAKLCMFAHCLTWCMLAVGPLPKPALWLKP